MTPAGVRARPPGDVAGERHGARRPDRGDGRRRDGGDRGEPPGPRSGHAGEVRRDRGPAGPGAALVVRLPRRPLRPADGAGADRCRDVRGAERRAGRRSTWPGSCDDDRDRVLRRRRRALRRHGLRALVEPGPARPAPVHRRGVRRRVHRGARGAVGLLPAPADGAVPPRRRPPDARGIAERSALPALGSIRGRDPVPRGPPRYRLA